MTFQQLCQYITNKELHRILQNLVSSLVLLDWDSEGGAYEDSCLLSCDTVQVLVVWLQRFG